MEGKKSSGHPTTTASHYFMGMETISSCHTAPSRITFWLKLKIYIYKH